MPIWLCIMDRIRVILLAHKGIWLLIVKVYLLKILLTVDSTLDIIPLAFLYIFFNSDGLPAINFAAACENTYFSGTGLLHCAQMGYVLGRFCADGSADIKTCQAAGKKILLSLGGAAGSYGFTSDSQAETFADSLWNLFGGGSSSTRPFDDAIIDGFDLDIEGGSTTGYAAFVNRMRTHYASDTSKSYYISAAPQCPLPDAYLNTVLTTAHVDFIFVQFYNNYCTFSLGWADCRWN